MIIVDLSQTMISNFMAQIGNHTNIPIEEDLLRHMILNSLRSYNSKYRNEYGEMVIACDDTNYWRREIFPYYKASRKTDRAKSEIDWNALFTILNKVRDELKEYFPYRVLQIKTAEADDIIGALCQEFGQEFGTASEKILIVSGDKDFKQLQTYTNVNQWDPVRKKMLVENNPEQYLREHIIKGDRGDGVPNFISQDDSLVMNIRQKQIRQKKLDVWAAPGAVVNFNEEELRGWKRNQQLVDLNYIPPIIKEEIIKEFHAQAGQDRSKLFNYFITFRLKNLLTDIDHF